MPGQEDELEVAFNELERRASVYARTWWTRSDGVHRRFLDAHPEVGPALNQRLMDNLETETWQVYAAPDGQAWSPERVPEQLRILDLLDAGDTAEDAGDDGQEGNIYFVLGLPGSGKSRVLRRVAAAHAARTKLPASDADDVRAEFAEYGGGLGSGVVQVETAVVTYGEKHLDGGGRQDRVLGKGGYAIVDVVGDQRYLPGTIEILARAGRKCYVLLAECPVEECKRRAMQRALETGRVVPMAVIDAKVGQPSQALRAALESHLVTGWAIVDTSGDDPVLFDGDGTFDNHV